MRGLSTLIPLVLAAVTAGATAETVTVEADRDATLIQDPDGRLANGSGPALFAGRTGQEQNSIRRGLLHFNLEGAVPRRALIQSVSLRLYLTSSNPEPSVIRLFRLLDGWGEGPSSASGGSGAPSEPGDVTWIHTVFDMELWVKAGGQFIGRPSAATEVADEGFVTIRNRAMLNDIRLWARAPASNFGWLLAGDETAPQTSKRFASRESSDASLRPVLHVTYRLPGRR